MKTRPDTRPSVADGWAGAEMHVFTLFDSIVTEGNARFHTFRLDRYRRTNGPTDGQTDGRTDGRTYVPTYAVRTRGVWGSADSSQSRRSGGQQPPWQKKVSYLRTYVTKKGDVRT